MVESYSNWLEQEIINRTDSYKTIKYLNNHEIKLYQK